VKVATLAYSTVLSTTFQLLHCVDVGGARVVFRAATVECGAWQAPFYTLAAALLLPVALVLAAAGGAPLPRSASVLPAMLRAPYREGCGHWEAALALHRLIVVAIYSSGGADSAVAAVLQTLVCCTAFAVHVLWQPFRERSANRAQTALLACLVVVALLNVPQAMLDTNAVTESEHANVLLGKLRDAEAVLLLAPAALVGAALLALAWRRWHDVAAAARAGCAVFARCSGENADEEVPLDELLLDSSDSDGGSDSGSKSKLFSNNRGLRLTHCTPGRERE
jgi:hypothetical protein